MTSRIRVERSSSADHSSNDNGKEMERHPSLDIAAANGTELQGKKIILCVTGSVAIYKAIELARLLVRHGSDKVTFVASKAATELVSSAYLKWATGNDVVSDLTGDLEHIRLADYNKSDMVVVYPATANTLGKLANGIDDTPVSTVLTVAFGSGTPIVVCPAMHESMYENPAVLRNVKFLKEMGVRFVGPQIAEGKAKASEPEQVLEYAIRVLNVRESPLNGMHVLLSAGPTIEYIDPVRVITNSSSGRTGVLLASEFLSAGATVTVVYGPGREEPPEGADVIRVETSADMQEAMLDELKKKVYDVVVMAAAVSDYTPVRKSDVKIKSTSDEHTIKLKRVPKIIKAVRGKMRQGALLVGFKAETDMSSEDLARAARDSMSESGADMVIANDIGTRYQEDQDMNNVIAVTHDTTKESGWCKKEIVVGFIRDAIEKKISSISPDASSSNASATTKPASN